jgi:uncharacterized hydrophobic protein (TIGR00271 family)
VRTVARSVRRPEEMDAGEPSDRMTEHVGSGPLQGWSAQLARTRRRGLEPEERRRVMTAVALRRADGWRFKFALMQALSVAVAVMGLSSGSAAVVIGAMLLAPLMVPVLGIAAAISMALPRHLGRSLGIVAGASFGSIALAYLLAVFLPAGQLSQEVLSRTSPDLRDLVVALAAGAAGAYATVRADVSTSLPGVAVAVALVPPLATIGITLEAGRGELVEGAALLYAANLTAIVLIGVFVFLVTGFVPPRRLRQTRLHVSGGAILVATITAAIAVPLALASSTASQSGRERDRVYAAVVGWLQGSVDGLDEVRIDDNDVVRVRVSGPTPPPPTADLERAVQQILGPAAVVEARWTQTQTPPDGDAEDGQIGDVADAQRREATVRRAVQAWLDDAARAGGAGIYDVERLEVTDEEIRLDLASAEPPPSLDLLTVRLSEEAGLTLPVVVNWTQRTTLRPGADAAATERELTAAALLWAEAFDELSVDGVSFDGSAITVELVGSEPVDVSDLERSLHEIVDPDTAITVWFTERRRLLPPPPTTTTTTTTTAPPPPVPADSPGGQDGGG